MTYIIPSGTRIGHVLLKVADLDRSEKFYHDLLGFEIQQQYGSQAVFQDYTPAVIGQGLPKYGN